MEGLIMADIKMSSMSGTPFGNTGGGGSGASATGGNGGSGVVIISYAAV